MSEQITPTFSPKVFLSAALLPAVYILIGFSLFIASYADNFFPFLAHWDKYLAYAGKVGNILIAVAVVTFCYKLIVLLAENIERRTAEKHAVASLILSSIRKGLRVIYCLILLNVIINIVGPSKVYLVFANNLINTVIIASVGWVMIQLFYTLEAILYHNMMAIPAANNLRVRLLYNKMHILRNIGTFVIIVITIAAILMTFSSVRNIGISILASAGFLTAIIGLAAQKSLFALFSGLQLAISQPIKLGDLVTIEGVSGVVEEITFTNVTLNLGDRRRIVPINFFIEKPFENWSADTRGLRASFTIFVDYLLPISDLRTEFERLLKHSKYWDKLFSRVEVANITYRAVEVSMQMSAASTGDLSLLKAEIKEKMLAYIRQHYPEYFPKMRIHDKQDDNQDDTHIIPSASQ